jgi:uncharacterized protein with beta-barrel porin domain
MFGTQCRKINKCSGRDMWSFTIKVPAAEEAGEASEAAGSEVAEVAASIVAEVSEEATTVDLITAEVDSEEVQEAEAAIEVTEAAIVVAGNEIPALPTPTHYFPLLATDSFPFLQLK